MCKTPKIRVKSSHDGLCINHRGDSIEIAIDTCVPPHISPGIEYKPPEYLERDFNEAPKFTTSLNDRATTVGYSTKLLCSVRGSPKVE